MAKETLKGYNVFQYRDQLKVSRLGTNVAVQATDGRNSQSDSVEANLLYEILMELRKKK